MGRKKKRARAGARPPDTAASPLPPPGVGYGKRLAAGALLALLIGGLVLYLAFSERKAAPPSAQYMGAKACAGCHAKEQQAWRGSHHDLAMQVVDEKTVLGNFDNATFKYNGVESTFFRRDGKFMVQTDGPDGKLHDYEVAYTFGVTPLQQYLIEFPDGRLQALTIVWDTRPKARGGQRWFHLYPGERITHEDELHWTRPSQNWNFMCAECHSTGVRKNYDLVTDRFQTQWAEINVSCEACHGPGSRHVAWATEKQAGRRTADDETKGLTARLDERRGVVWTVDTATGNAVRSQPRNSDREIEVCAQCHSRRSQIAEGYEAGKRFLDHYRPALLPRPLYHADGQQRDEVYNWGSFLQSKMYASGVTCSDCHDPHSGKLRAQGNAVCATCHLPSKYDTTAHHHHKPGTAGAECAACHMPTTTYMVIDPRHDHSLRVPRPDLSVKLGTPNACNACHSKRDTRWAAVQVRAWYGRDAQGHQQFAAAFRAADTGAADAAAELLKVTWEPSQPAIARATALAGLGAQPSRAALEGLAEGLRDPDPLVRFGAVQALAQAPQDARASLAPPLLADPVKSVRIEAASALADVPAERLDATHRAAFERAAGEYVETQRYNADRAEARVNLGTFYANRGDLTRAEEELKAAIRLEPLFVPAYVNLADLYRARGRDGDGERILREGITMSPASAVLHHALGLALVRMQRVDEALAELERATTLESDNARFAYVYAVGLHSAGRRDAAIRVLENAVRRVPDDPDLLFGLAAFHRERGALASAVTYAERLAAVAPEDPRARELLAELRRR